MKETKIKPAYEHSKAGRAMFYLCAKWTEFIVKRRWLYYLLACTWGFLMTFVGAVVTIALAIAMMFGGSVSFERYLWIYRAKAGPDYWGGFETGLMFVRDHKSADSVDKHEFGHTFQACLLGPLMIFAVSLPSAIRYWVRELKYSKKGLKPATDYDAAWFEDSATQCGRFAYEYILCCDKNGAE